MLLTLNKEYNRAYRRGDSIFFKKSLVATENGPMHKYYAFVGDSSPFATLAETKSTVLPETTPMTDIMIAKLPDWIEVMVLNDSYPAEPQVVVRLDSLSASMLKN